MKRSTLVWTVLALALVTMLAVACDRPVNPAPQNTASPTDVGGDFPPNYTPPPVPTRPTGSEPKATTAPSAPTTQPTAGSQATTAPVPTTAPANPTTAPQATTVSPAATPTSTTSPAPGTETTYTVQPGDTLFRIALAYGLSWETVASYNGITNPNAIYVGQVLKIPPTGSAAATPAPTAKTYVVQPGDNLFRIALAYGYSYLTVAEYNGISWPYWVYPGQVIRFP